MASGSGIMRNYALFLSLIRDCQETGMSVKESYKGVEKLTCAKIKLDDDDHAQEIFERINSTGIPLSLADKIRNFVLMTDADQDELYEQYWRKIKLLLDKDWLTAFFLDYLNLKIHEGFVKEDEAYNAFKLIFGKQLITNRAALQEILHYAEFYHAFLYRDERYGDEISALLADFKNSSKRQFFSFCPVCLTIGARA